MVGKASMIDIEFMAGILRYILPHHDDNPCHGTVVRYVLSFLFSPALLLISEYLFKPAAIVFATIARSSGGSKTSASSPKDKIQRSTDLWLQAFAVKMTVPSGSSIIP